MGVVVERFDRLCRILVAPRTIVQMKTVRRFSTFDELKAADRSETSDAPSAVLKRHRAFERLMKDIREPKKQRRRFTQR